MIDTILFDVDGTLLDTEYVMTESLSRALKKVSNLNVPLENLEFILGIPGVEAVKRFSKSNEEKDQILRVWNQYVKELSSQVQLFDGVVDLLNHLKLKGLRLGIVTSKTKKEMITEFNKFKINNYFEVIITASDTERHKPFPDPILKAIEVLGSTSDKTIYLGDSVYDMRSSNESNVLFALAAWGAKDNEAFESVSFVLHKPEDLIKLIEAQGW
ncbi:HAD family hydrolase [Enterococcus faecium]|nr:HAD family hydrolase [Enterococcus faecium]